MARVFVYLVIADREVSNFLRRLRAEINGADTMGEVHLTIRGPYDRSKGLKSHIERWQSLVDNSPVVVSGVGKFHNQRESIVYLKVQHPSLRRLWWKPDYPISKYGFNPHLTLYAGENRVFADAIYDLLAKRQFALISHANKIATSTSKQEPLFSENEPLHSDYLRLLEVRKVPLLLLQEVSDIRRRVLRGG